MPLRHGRACQGALGQGSEGLAGALGLDSPKSLSQSPLVRSLAFIDLLKKYLMIFNDELLAGSHCRF